MSRIAVLEAQATGFRAGADIYEEHRRGCLPLALLINGGILFAGIIGTYLDGPWQWLPWISLAVLVYVGLQVRARFYPDEREGETSSSPGKGTLSQAACSNCGGSVPVIVGMPLECPFCTAALIPSVPVAAVIEQAAATQVTVEASRYSEEMKKAQSPRALIIFLVVIGIAMALFTVACMVLQVLQWREIGFPWQ